MFRSQRLPLPGGAAREFDAVSDDGSIVVSIKTSSGLTSGGNLPGGKIKAAIADLYYLSLIGAPTRWLVLTNPKFHEIFSRVMDGAVSPGIVVRLTPLSAELQGQLAPPRLAGHAHRAGADAGLAAQPGDGPGHDLDRDAGQRHRQAGVDEVGQGRRGQAA